MLLCVRVVEGKTKVVAFKHENYAWQNVYFGWFFIGWGWIWPLPSTHSPPISFRDQYTAPSRSWGTISGAEPGEKQNNWSWEPSVITSLSLVQLDGQKVKSCSLEYKENAEQHVDDLRLKERKNLSDLLDDWVILIPFGNGRINPLFSLKVWLGSVCQPCLWGISYSLPVVLHVERTDWVGIFVPSLLFMKWFFQS